MNKTSVVISTPSDIDRVKSALVRSFHNLKEIAEIIEFEFEVLDSFDWRLHKKGWQLLNKEGHYSIVRAKDGKVISEIDAGRKKDARFIKDFPDSNFSRKLVEVLEMRALLPVAKFKKKVNRVSLCNEDDKITAHIEFEELTIPYTGHTVTRCSIVPVRGYNNESREIRKIFNELNMPPARVPAVVDLLEQVGIRPGSYSSKINVILKPDISAAKSVQLILGSLVKIMHLNIEGVKENIDTEFLHDLRVAIRRARSLLGQTEGVIDVKTKVRLQTYLKTMSAATGRVRDLDVYLLKKDEYLSKVPESMKNGVIRLFSVLQRRRRDARNRMIKAIAGAEFKDALEGLDRFIESDLIVKENTTGIISAADLARKVIFKRFTKVIKYGGRISIDTPINEFHRLRIECKKLRYLMEFFESLFPEHKVKLLIGQLKKLQENLGDFNDLSVQQKFLNEYIAGIDPKTSQSIMLAAATGSLITLLAYDQAQVRSHFLGVFRVFSSNENKEHFKALFN